ncbi:hypothetical protein TrLO_g3946 [Triparma laevis f. longispina]|uniref:Uncharacterized protein n=1 Tax=Triparma laevis f. longispina TaxID=1714387 RepID=A0A9W7L0S6_9STRA|nr:hypothetical protein TrLO_g3946 [Triparma laevis f. longispina]
MLENLKRQCSVRPLTDDQKAHTLAMMYELQTLYFGDDSAQAKYGDAKYWENLSGGRLHIVSPGDQAADSKSGLPNAEESRINDTPAPTSETPLMSAVAEVGYHVSPPPSTAASLSLAINHTLSALASAGWPPQFLLLYDETWALLADTIAQQYSSFSPDLILEADVNVWHLTRPVGEETIHEEASPSPSPIHPQIGSNFPNPHRDMVYSECHDDDEAPTSLSVWIPLTPSGATTTNGCMRVLPLESDDFFYSPNHPFHSQNSRYEDGGDEERLEVPQFGSAAWDPSCVHWGGSCEAGSEAEPRASLAFTVRKRDATKGEFTVGGEQSGVQQTGPASIPVAKCHEGGIRRRLSVVSKAILGYSHHWPGLPFDGFEANLVTPVGAPPPPPVLKSQHV